MVYLGNIHVYPVLRPNQILFGGTSGQKMESWPIEMLDSRIVWLVVYSGCKDHWSNKIWSALKREGTPKTSGFKPLKRPETGKATVCKENVNYCCGVRTGELVWHADPEVWLRGQNSVNTREICTRSNNGKDFIFNYVARVLTRTCCFYISYNQNMSLLHIIWN